MALRRLASKTVLFTTRRASRRTPTMPIPMAEARLHQTTLATRLLGFSPNPVSVRDTPNAAISSVLRQLIEIRFL
jgi:hypothetical protein